MAKTAAEKALDKLHEGEPAPALNGEIVDTGQSLVLREFGSGEVAIGHFATATGFQGLPDNLTYDDFQMLLKGVGMLKAGMLWMAGDLLVRSSDRLGEAYAQIADLCGYDDQMMQQAEGLARSFPYETRHRDLPWTYHQVVRSIAPGCKEHFGRPRIDCDKCAPGLKERDDWLVQCVEHQWDRKQLRDHVAKARGRSPKARPGRPRKPDSKTPARSKKPDEKAIEQLLTKKLEPELVDAIKATKGFLKKSEEMLNSLEVDGLTTPMQAARVVKMAEDLGQEATILARMMLELRKHALVVRDFKPGPRTAKQQEKKAAAAPKTRKKKPPKLEGDPVAAAQAAAEA